MNKPLSPEQITSLQSATAAAQPALPKATGPLRKRKPDEQDVLPEEQQASQAEAEASDAAQMSSSDVSAASSTEAGVSSAGAEVAQGVAVSAQAGQAASVVANATSMFGGISTLSIAGGAAALAGVAAAAGGGGSKDSAPAAPAVVVPVGTGNIGAGTVADPIIVNADGSVQIGAQGGGDWSYSTDGGVTWKPGTGAGIPAGELNEGNNTIQIVQVDKAGKPSVPTIVTVVKDTTAPVAPALDVANSGTGAQTGTIVGSGTAADPIVIGSDGKVSISAESDADWRFSTDGGVTWQPGTGTGISANDLNEGTNTIQIVQIDKAGNPSAPTTVTVVKDTTAPVAPVLDVTNSGTGSQAGTIVGSGTAADPIVIGSDGKVSISAESDADWRFSTDGGVTWQPGTGTGISANDLNEGTNTIQIVQIDKAGNCSAPTIVTVVKDTTAPVAPALDVANSGTGAQTGTIVGSGTAADPIVIGSDGKVSISAESDADWRFSTDGGVTWQPGSGTGISANDLNEGTNTIQIVQVDKAGNPSAPTTVTVVKDTTAPVAPALDVANSGTGAQTGTIVGSGTAADPIVIGSDGKVSISAESDADWRFSTDGGVTWQPGTGTAISANDLNEGTNTIQIVQVDKAGNPSAPTIVTVVKDTTAPVAPVLDVANSGTGAQTGTIVGSGTAADPIVIGSDGKVSISAESDADWRFSTDGGVTWQPGTGTGISANDLNEGTNTIQIVQVDKAGNCSAPTIVTVVKDTTAPVAPTLDVANSGTGAQTGTIVGSGTAADPIVIGSDGKVSISAESDADWRFSTDGGVTWQPGTGTGISANDLNEGTNTIQIVQVDKAGNPSAPTIVTVVKDTTAPVAPVLDVANSGTGAQTGTIVGSGTAADPIVIGSDGKVSISAESDADWRFSTDGGVTWQPGTGTGISANDLNEGTNTIQIVQIDKAGNCSAPTIVTVVKDTTAPVAPALDVANSGTGAQTGTIVGSGTAADPIVIGSDGKVSISAESDADWRFSTDGGVTWQPGTGTGISANDLNEGTNTIQIVQVDKAGNCSAPTIVTVVKDTTAPVAPTLDVANSGTGAQTGTIVGSGTAADPIVIGSDGKVSISAESDADWRFSTDGGVTWQPGTGTGISANDLNEGTNTIQIVQVDKAGNCSAPTIVTVVKDTTAPVAPTLDVANSGTGAQTGTIVGSGTAADPIVIGSDGKVSISAESDADWRFSTDGGVTWQPGTGTGISANDLNEGTNTIQIVQVDKAGNCSAPTIVTVVKDTTAPVAPTLDVANSGTGAQTGTVVGTGTADDPIVVSQSGKVTIATEAGADWRFSTDGGITWQQGTDAGIPATDLQEGTNTIQIVQIDKAGNGSAVTSITVIKDSVAPEVPVLHLPTEGGDAGNSGLIGAGTVDDPLLMGPNGVLAIDVEPDAEWHFSTDGGETWTKRTGTGLTADDLIEGRNTVQIVQVDRAGNISPAVTVEIVRDTTPPSAPDVQRPVPGTGTPENPVVLGPGGTLEVTVEPDTEWRFSTDNGLTWQSGTAAGISVADLAEGSNTVQVVQLDQAGNVSAPTVIEVIKDTVALAPTLQAFTHEGLAVGNPPAINLAGQVKVGGLEAGGQWSFSVDNGVTWQTGEGDSIAASALAEGLNKIQIKQTDAVGNVSGIRSLSVILDNDVSVPTALAFNTTSHDAFLLASGSLLSDVLRLKDIDFGRSSFTMNGAGLGGVDREGAIVSSVTVISAKVYDIWVMYPDYFTKAVKVRLTELDGGGVVATALNCDYAEGFKAPGFDWDAHVGNKLYAIATKPTTGFYNVSKLLLVSKSPVDGHVNDDGRILLEGMEAGARWEFSADGGETWTRGSGNFIPAGALPEGAQSVQIIQVDRAGNASAPTTLSLVKDSVAPLAPMAASSAGLGTGTVADPIVVNAGGMVTVSTENGASWKFSKDGGLTWQKGTGGGISDASLTEGTNTLKIVQVDGAGNASAATTLTVVKDTIAPDAPNVTVVDAANAPAVTLSATGSLNIDGLEPGSQWYYSTDGGQTWTMGSGTSIPAGSLVEGNNSVQVKQFDAAGNESGATAIEVIKDSFTGSSLTISNSETFNEHFFIPNQSETFSVPKLADIDLQSSKFVMWLWSKKVEVDLLYVKNISGTETEIAVGVKATNFQSDVYEHYTCARITLVELPEGGISATMLSEGKLQVLIGDDPINGTHVLRNMETSTSESEHGVGLAEVRLNTRQDVVRIDGVDDGHTWQYSTDDGLTWTVGEGQWLELGQLPGTGTVQLAEVNESGTRGEITVLNRDGTQVSASPFAGMFGSQMIFGDALFDSTEWNGETSSGEDSSSNLEAMLNAPPNYELPAQTTVFPI